MKTQVVGDLASLAKIFIKYALSSISYDDMGDQHMLYLYLWMVKWLVCLFESLYSTEMMFYSS